MRFDVSELKWFDLAAMAAGLLLIVNVLLLPWFDLSDTTARERQGAWVCGTDELSCTAWGTNDISRFIYILGGLAPFVLAWILVRRHALGWPAGEMSAVLAAVVATLIFYNGAIKKPGVEPFGVGLTLFYWLGWLTAIALLVAAAWRMVEEGGGADEKPPGTF